MLHVVDASNPFLVEHIKAVNSVLEELDCIDKPTILVLNKIDKLADAQEAEQRVAKDMERRPSRLVTVSARKKIGLDQLSDAVISILSEDMLDLHLTIHSGNGKALAYLAAHAEVYHQETVEDDIKIDFRLPKALAPKLEAMGVPLADELVGRSSER